METGPNSLIMPEDEKITAFKLSRWPLYVVIAVAAVMVCVLVWSISFSGKNGSDEAGQKDLDISENGPPLVVAENRGLAAPSLPVGVARQNTPAPSAPAPKEPLIVVQDKSGEADRLRQQELENLRRRRAQAQLDGLTAPLGLKRAQSTQLHDKSLPNVAQNLGRYRKKRVKAKHHPTLVEPAAIGDFVVRLQDYRPKYKGTKALPHTIYGVWLVLYTMKRPHEVCEGKWAEIDFEQKLWRKSAESNKTGLENDECPLSEQALKILRELHKVTGDCEYMFPGGAKNLHIVPETLRKLIIEGLGYAVGELTTHGLRGMFSTTGNELGFNFEAVEKQLSHNIGNEVSQAYNHAKYLKMRRVVVQKYADWLHVQANKVRKKKMQVASEQNCAVQDQAVQIAV